MTAILFDTLEFANQLKTGGFTEQQAETQARVMASLVEKQLNTKQETQDHENRIEIQIIEIKRDLKEMDTALRHEIELLRADTGRMIAETKAELVRWVVGVGLLQTSLIIGALMKMAHLI